MTLFPTLGPASAGQVFRFREGIGHRMPVEGSESGGANCTAVQGDTQGIRRLLREGEPEQGDTRLALTLTLALTWRRYSNIKEVSSE